jgi:capsular polysaccharide biosynthesis protein
VNEADQPTGLSLSHNDDLPGRLWAFDEFSTGGDRPAGEVSASLVGLGFIRAALKRGIVIWGTLGAVGLLLGLGYFVGRPPAYQASASVLLTNSPGVQPSDAMLDNTAVAESRTVAAAALKKLGIDESADTFTKNYTVTPLTSRVLLFSVKAQTSDEAVREANALASAFLAFQATQLQTQGKLVVASLQQQIVLGQKNVDALTTQITQLLAQPQTQATRAKVSRLRTERTQQVNALDLRRTALTQTNTGLEVSTATVVRGSQVLDHAIPVVQSRKRLMLIYAVTGLLMGLALGAGFVVVRALVSDRLRRRDDVARALGAPVKVSVGKVRLGRGQTLESDPGPEIKRIVTHLQRALPPTPSGLTAMALIPVDDPGVAAMTLVSLALSNAQQGLKVVLADLASGGPAAQLLGVTQPGVHMVRMNDAHLVVTVPEPDDVVPIGPLDRRPHRDHSAEQLSAACGSANLLLTLAALDPSVGGDHLAGWARSAVATVTAGKSSAVKIHAVGEMIRLAGAELISGVLIGADKTDESLGVVNTPSGTVAQVFPTMDHGRT